MISNRLTLADPLPNRVKISDDELGVLSLEVNLPFDTVLRCFELQKEDIFTVEEKVDTYLDMLLTDITVIRKYPLGLRLRIVDAVFKQFIARPPKQGAVREKNFDFIQDADYIYAAFMADYMIDLMQAQGSLDWRKFYALFIGLTAQNRICEIMSIRAREIPERNNHNGKEIDKLLELKQLYALEYTEEERESNFQKSLNAFGEKLRQRASG